MAAGTDDDGRVVQDGAVATSHEPKSKPKQRSRSRSRSRSGSVSQRTVHRLRKKYHKMALKNKLKPITEDTVDERGERFSPRERGRVQRQKVIDRAKKEIISELTRSAGDANSGGVQRAVDSLAANYDRSSFDPRKLTVERPGMMWTSVETQLEDTWMSLTKPEFKDCLGKNSNNDCLYTLGRMTFGMLQPTQLVCSIQGVFNEIKAVNGMDEEAVKYVPSNLKADVRDGNVQVRSYDIITALTIEPYQERFGENSPNKGVDEPIQALLTVNCFIIPYPKQNRFAVWFTGGYVEVNGGSEQWGSLFNEHSIPMRTLSERATLFVAGLLMGATTNDEMGEDGRLCFELTKPLAANIDLLYMDELIRVMRSSKGTTYIFVRANPSDYSSSSDESCSSRASSTSNSSLQSLTRNTSPPLRPNRSYSPGNDATRRTKHDAPPKRPARGRDSPKAEKITVVGSPECSPQWIGVGADAPKLPKRTTSPRRAPCAVSRP